MVQYSFPIRQDHLVHSLDNLVVEYIVPDFNTGRVIEQVGDVFRSVLGDEWSLDKFSKLNCPACSKYDFFRDHVWGAGFHLSFGQFTDYDRVAKQFDVVPLLRVKFNPNKYYDTPLASALFAYFRDFCASGALLRFDYAIDVPCRLKDVVVHSRKEKGLYKGTLYYGQRNKHGRLKIYDKDLESDNGDLLTRVEWTFSYGKPFSFDDVSYLTSGPVPLPDVRDMDSRSRNFVLTLLHVRSLGGDVMEDLERFDYRTRKKFEPYVLGQGVKLVGDDCSVLVSLLRDWCSRLNLSFKSGGVNPLVIGSCSRLYGDLDFSEEELPF